MAFILLDLCLIYIAYALFELLHHFATCVHKCKRCTMHKNDFFPEVLQINTPIHKVCYCQFSFERNKYAILTSAFHTSDSNVHAEKQPKINFPANENQPPTGKEHLSRDAFLGFQLQIPSTDELGQTFVHGGPISTLAIRARIRC